MKKSKFIRMLKTLNREELVRFKDFLHSPYFNKNKKCTQLIELLLPFAPNFDNDQLESATLLQPIYSNKNSIKTLLQLMLRLFEEFLAVEELNKQHTSKKYLILKQLLAKREVKQYKNLYTSLASNFESLKKQSLTDLYYRFLIEAEHLDYQFSSTEITAPKYDDLWYYMDKSFLISRLKYTSSMANEQRIRSLPMNIPSTEIVLDFANEERFAEEPIVLLYKTAYLLISENNQSDFEKLLVLLKENVTILRKKEANFLYSAAINYCLRNIAKGTSSYYNDLFNIYKSCLEEDLFLVNNYLPPQRLYNLVVVGALTKNFEWTENFLDNNKSHIEKDFRDLVFHFCKGILYHNQGNFSKASDELLEANYVGTPKSTSQLAIIKFFKINIQTLLLKIYYEEEETLAFESLVKSLAERIRQTKDINQKEIKGYLNFISTTNLLFKYKVDPNFKKKLADIEEKLNTFQHISNKKWLLGKIKELQK